VAKLFNLNAAQVEDALGIACTQACGLMSAQFESEVKRMQHGFAARNGLFAAILARRGYVGIKKVYEREYGGFLDMFSKGNGKSPQFLIDELTKNLGNEWKTAKVRVKPYAAMAATHGVVDCVRKLQEEYADEMKDLEGIESVKLTMGEVAFHHGGFDISRPITTVGGQMSAKYVAATQIVDGEVMPREFRYDMLERDKVWRLVEKIKCVQSEKKGEEHKWKTIAEVKWKDGREAKVEVIAARGVKPELSNEEIVEKWRAITRDVIDDERRSIIEKTCLGIEELDDVMVLGDLLAGVTRNPIA
jgi:aconitate decarboxylase